MTGDKHDMGKPRYDLIPPEVLAGLAKIYTYGAGKYGERNCERGFDYGRLYAAAFRHMQSFWGGEDFDQESGLPHLDHAAWNLLMLGLQRVRQIGMDDRTVPDEQG